MFRFVLYKTHKTTNEKKRNEAKQRNFLIINLLNETMITFEEFWQLLYDHGSRNYYKNDTWARWNELTLEQQQTLYNTISTKIRTGKFVDYNPLEAIHDNLTRKNRPTGEPTNYNGEQLAKYILQAWYNSRRKLQSRGSGQQLTTIINNNCK